MTPLSRRKLLAKATRPWHDKGIPSGIPTMQDTLIACPKCQTSLRIKTAAAGTRFRCPRCGEAFAAPEQTLPSSAPAEPIARVETTSDHDDPKQVTRDRTNDDAYRT